MERRTRTNRQKPLDCLPDFIRGFDQVITGHTLTNGVTPQRCQEVKDNAVAALESLRRTGCESDNQYGILKSAVDGVRCRVLPPPPRRIVRDLWQPRSQAVRRSPPPPPRSATAPPVRPVPVPTRREESLPERPWCANEVANTVKCNDHHPFEVAYTCSICGVGDDDDDDKTVADVVVMPCKHRFCQDCALTALQHSTTCSLCRGEIKCVIPSCPGRGVVAAENSHGSSPLPLYQAQATTVRPTTVVEDPRPCENPAERVQCNDHLPTADAIKCSCGAEADTVIMPCKHRFCRACALQNKSNCWHCRQRIDCIIANCPGRAILAASPLPRPSS